jgi:hypothetical protein
MEAGCGAECAGGRRGTGSQALAVIDMQEL